MNNLLIIGQIIVSIALIVLILLQPRGTGLGSIFGGGAEFYQRRRGLEKTVFYITIVLAGIFLVLNVVALIQG
ncbi:MAG: preprotein translocase subunit SecG [Candidatus Pacebacteria bacterium]|nr:preprotein translocase subunit SecG [Candidatus Paceibacterota bacterium]